DAIHVSATEVYEEEEPAAPVRLPATQIDREIQILADAGMARIVEWLPPVGPHRDPRPARVTLNGEFLKATPQATAALHRIIGQVTPDTPAPAADQRTQALSRLMQNGQLLTWPAQFKRQVWVMEEVAKAFEPQRLYPEREVDAILKEIY